MALGQAVYDRRKELGLSQKDVAERAGMTQPQISNIEQAGAEPTLALLRRLAKALEARLSIDLDEEDSTFAFTPLIEDKLRGLAFPGQASDCLFHAAIRNFSYSAWTSRGGR
ncbi:transcriptional regulator with XRE-family HTH domain [Streptomyces pseudovenezuelae]|uniref:Transcriptional regulator with XRE-family HTH domain n=1 Tax=Streptomyces pseudovenezuelae TaxID=67350 RepID=A0ABT6M365_9ACTN|nr:transcriptional regulator with XRE-family HTH domain [Streptomyces pseudovenezuelae]